MFRFLAVLFSVCYCYLLALPTYRLVPSEWVVMGETLTSSYHSLVCVCPSQIVDKDGHEYQGRRCHQGSEPAPRDRSSADSVLRASTLESTWNDPSILVTCSKRENTIGFSCWLLCTQLSFQCIVALRFYCRNW